MSRLNSVFNEIEKRKECALITYITVGFPTLNETIDLVESICSAGADIVELGVPFSDPVADGPIIRKAGQIALENGVTVKKCIEAAAKIRKRGIEKPLVMMGYCNPFLSYGIEKLFKACAFFGIDGLIIPDLPPEQAGQWVEEAKKNNIDIIFFVSPTTSQERLKSIVKYGSGFLYCVSVTGITGMRTELDSQLPNFISDIKQVTTIPIAVGFGISTPSHVEKVATAAEGAIVGSALIDTIYNAPIEQRSHKASEFVKRLKSATKRRGA